jgi:hypothetical protein
MRVFCGVLVPVLILATSSCTPGPPESAPPPAPATAAPDPAPAGTGAPEASPVAVAPGPGEIAPGVITSDPSQYLGERVAVRGGVEGVFGAHVVTLDAAQPSARRGLVVLLPSGAPGVAKPRDVIRVTGTVRPFVRSQIQRDYDWFEQGWMEAVEKAVDLEGGPVLVADSIRTVSGAEVDVTRRER